MYMYKGGLAPWKPGTCQVGRLVRRPGGPLRQMFKEWSGTKQGLMALS